MHNPLHRIIVACRTQAKADATRQSLLHLLPPTDETNRSIKYHENIIALECDHASFASIREFDERLRIKLNETYTPNKWIYNGIDVLCCNAAILVPKDSLPQYTDDGYEVTFQTNYLSPFLLVQSVMDLMNPGGRIVFTTSGLYDRVNIQNLNGIIADPDTTTTTTNNHENHHSMVRKHFPMIDDCTEFHYKTSYSISKLCVVGLCAELAERIPQRRHISVNCFSPGLMTTSGLFRHQPFPNDCNNSAPTEQQQQPKQSQPPHDHHSVDILQKEKSVEWGAGALVYMIIGQDTGKRNAEYWSDAHSTLGIQSQYGVHFTPIDITNRVNAATRKDLWKLSCQLVGIVPSKSSSTLQSNGDDQQDHDALQTCAA
jgi:NAD(P)-dependent dehydrogenase (short-subunit alcohol dehydrogenase family)